ncbi:hypothetical protein D9M70_423880 [compost metagenome]
MKSGLSGWVLAIARTLDTYRVGHESIFQQVGMDTAGLVEGSARYQQETVSRLWRAAVAATGDKHFGLKVAKQIRPSTFSVVGYAMSCSATLGDALHRFARYAKLISSSATVILEENDQQLSLTCRFDTGGAPPLFETIDTVLAGLVCFSSWIAGKQITPVEVCFKRERPACIKEYVKLLKCPLRFGHSEDCLVFHAKDMVRPILSADEHLATLLDSMASAQIAELSERFSKKVRNCLLLQMEQGEISRKGTATLLHMTERTLLRRLKDENTTFQEVLDRLREELAYEYLQNSDCTVLSVSSKLGFSDASTFSRAFKRWTGRRPSLAQHAAKLYANKGGRGSTV